MPPDLAHGPPAEPSAHSSAGGETPPPRPLLEVGLLATLSALLLLDLLDDARALPVVHVAVEVGGALFALALAVRLWLRWSSTNRALELRVHDLRGALRDASEDAHRWRAEAHEALQGLGAAIERQCDRWSLTEAERAVALLLLKGLSMKEIADVRGTAERTARQQALAVYRKAGLAGRAELAAFFLEDLLLPSSTSSSSS
jgi:DNA-binding CsgD family transcriptional regulator